MTGVTQGFPYLQVNRPDPKEGAPVVIVALAFQQGTELGQATELVRQALENDGLMGESRGWLLKGPNESCGVRVSLVDGVFKVEAVK